MLDIAVLAAYCQSYATWRTASETLAQMAERDGATHGLMIKRQDGNAARPGPSPGSERSRSRGQTARWVRAAA